MKVIDDEGIELGEINRISLKPDDVILIDFKDKTISQSNVSIYYDKLKSYFPNNKILFLSNGIEMSIMNGGNSNE